MTRQACYHQRKPWVRFVMWSKDRCRRDPNYAGVENTLTAQQVEILWNRDKASGLRKASLDRKDSTEGYTFDNCQFIEFSENVAKRNREQVEAPPDWVTGKNEEVEAETGYCPL